MGQFRIYKRGNIAFLNVKEVTAYLDGGAAGREHGPAEEPTDTRCVESDDLPSAAGRRAVYLPAERP